MKTIAFNSGRTYTANGQRIACAEIDGGVYLSDIDRGIYGFLPGIALSRYAIMQAYDSGSPRMEYAAPSCDTNKVERGKASEALTKGNELRATLQALASELPKFNN